MSCDSPPTARHIRGVRAVIFDLDDTLYPEQSYAHSGFAAVAAWLKDRIDCPFDPGARMQELFFTGDRRHVFDQLLQEMNHAQPQSLIPAMIECYREHTPAIELHPDARLTLEKWHGQFRLGLISDGPLRMQQRKVEALRLEQWLDHVILTDRWGPDYWKPHQRAFQHLEETLALTGAAFLYVADNCGKDFVAPRQLGWRTAWMCRPEGVYRHVPAPAGGEPEFQVQSLTQLDLSPGVP